MHTKRKYKMLIVQLKLKINLAMVFSSSSVSLFLFGTVLWVLFNDNIAPTTKNSAFFMAW